MHGFFRRPEGAPIVWIAMVKESFVLHAGVIGAVACVGFTACGWAVALGHSVVVIAAIIVCATARYRAHQNCDTLTMSGWRWRWREVAATSDVHIPTAIGLALLGYLLGSPWSVMCWIVAAALLVRLVWVGVRPLPWLQEQKPAEPFYGPANLNDNGNPDPRCEEPGA